jgi:2-phosphoglycerate kinase
MVILITGASHTGKTYLAQKMLEKYKYPYLSIDHLKMGLIRSGHTDLTPISADKELTDYLWPIVSEIIKTAIENNQNLIVEGCYIPCNWQKSFESKYLKNIACYCLVMSDKYIRNHFDDISNYANVIEKRLEDDLTVESVIGDNMYYFSFAQSSDVKLVLIDDEYNVEGLLI